MLTDLALISILLASSQLLRAALRPMNRILAPTPILAGVFGLVLGPQILGVLPFSTTADGSQLSLGQWPGVLVVAVFATLLMGHRPAEMRGWARILDVRDTLFYNLATEIGQYGLAILFGIGVLSLLYANLPQQFCVMLAAGFAGGHGTAAIFGQGFAAEWQDAQTIGFAFATIGLMISIVGGVCLLNIGARRGWQERLPGANATESLDAVDPAAKRSAVSPSSFTLCGLEPLTWHVSLVVGVYSITMGIERLVLYLVPGEYWLPGFAVAMLVGAAVQRALDFAGLGQLIDKVAMRRLGALCADYLVACGVASIKLNVVREFAGPIAVMSLFGTLYAIAVFFLARRLFPSYWFERSIFTYGWNTGTLGVSIALLKAIDPEMRSPTLQDYGASYLIIGPAEMLLYPAIIWACTSGHSLPAGLVLTILAAAMFATARRAPAKAASTAASLRAAEILIPSHPIHPS